MSNAADVGETLVVLRLEENEQRITEEQFEGQGCPPPRPVFPTTAARRRGRGATVGESRKTRRSTKWCTGPGHNAHLSTLLKIHGYLIMKRLVLHIRLT